MEAVVKKLLNHLKKIEAWEAKLIETDECWHGVYPQFTRELYSDWMKLQKERNELSAAGCRKARDNECLEHIQNPFPFSKPL